MSTHMFTRVLTHPRTPMIIGVVLIFLVVRLLMVHSPMPGSLASSHGRIVGLCESDSCRSCHADEGLAVGCLRCHEEIAAQLDGGVGYHHFLLEQGERACTPCHAEHHGARFPLVSQRSWGAQTPAAFKHPHVDSFLEGKHDNLGCEDCHEKKLREPFALKDFPGFSRERTFLGLTRECAFCHEDVHTGGLSGPCDACHGQEAFRPTTLFDHGRHFPLEGGHENLDCARCHLIPRRQTSPKPLPFPFDTVRGRTCGECHESPHPASFAEPCDTCHAVSEPLWSEGIALMTPQLHAASGFRLSEPHTRVACAKCHPRELAFRERYPDPAAPGYLRGEDTCEGCHEDVHEGQFQEQGRRCLDCHDKHRFRPSTHGHQAHARAFPLTGAHQAVACVSCHRRDATTEVRRFVSTSHECKVCHENPHGSQFSAEISEGDCSACHNKVADTFSLRPFDHQGHTGFVLEGAHATADCSGCHVEVLTPLGVAGAPRRYRGTPTACSSCHTDVHRGQFREDGYTDCSRCHVSAADWKEIEFDHDRSSFPLVGAHVRVPCGRCHLGVTHEDGSQVVQYKPLGSQCRDCHEIDSESPKSN